MLPALVGDRSDSLEVRRHLAGCAACKKESLRYSGLRTALSGLRSITTEPPPDLLGSLLAVPRRPNRVAEVRSHVAKNRKAYVGGAVLLAGAASAAIWRARSHRAA